MYVYYELGKKGSKIDSAKWYLVDLVYNTKWPAGSDRWRIVKTKRLFDYGVNTNERTKTTPTQVCFGDACLEQELGNWQLMNNKKKDGVRKIQNRGQGVTLGVIVNSSAPPCYPSRRCFPPHVERSSNERPKHPGKEIDTSREGVANRFATQLLRLETWLEKRPNLVSFLLIFKGPAN